MKKFFFVLAAFMVTCTFAQDNYTIDVLRVRDPFILADSASRTYYLYNSSGLRNIAPDNPGVDVFTSKDLKIWEGPFNCFSIPDNFWAKNMVWAPEVHQFNGKYYMFVTFTSHDTIISTPENPFRPDWTKPYRRGTQILWSDSPMGPFHIFENKPTTPEDWMCLDGTLYVENNQPYMVFCHEWVQINDGRIDFVKLKSDLSATEGTPFVLFKASEAPWVVTKKTGNVTDGPFLYRTAKGKLLMIWSGFGENGYAAGIAYSKTGGIAGPWKQFPELLISQDGGHGMIFRTFEGRLMFVFHQPNNSPNERLNMIEIEEKNNLIKILK
jgi:GH43 family beta-xylosidase